MKIVVVSGFYSEGMGYAENCLPKALATLGHEVHVVTSKFNVYGNSPDYGRTYESFLGPADQGVRRLQVDGYTVHRLASRFVWGYVWIDGLAARIRRIEPEVVHCTEVASLQCFVLAALKPLLGFKLFTETHQHMSVVKPFMKQRRGSVLRRAGFRVTRTLPTAVASLAVEKCYAIAPDCVEVATRFYGVPQGKIKLQSLGTDTQLFRPANSGEERASRCDMRRAMGYADDDIVCIYTGRFSADKNPLLLAQAVAALSERKERFKSLFVGEGAQKGEIAACRHARIVPFMKHTGLAELYRMADIAVWPRQESMSMLDAAACELPLVVSDTIGETDRVDGNGALYRENSVDDLVRALESLSSADHRAALGSRGRAKMIDAFSWTSIARSILRDYATAGVQT